MAEAQKKGKDSAPQPLVAQPLRENEPLREPTRFKTLFSSLATNFPYIRRSLTQADMPYSPAAYMQLSAITAFYVAAILTVLSWMLVRNETYALLLLIILFPIFYMFGFVYSLYYPQVMAKKRAKNMEQELVFAGRHMLIELKAGIPIFDSMLGISRDYGEVSTEFNKVVEKVTLGVPLGQAMHEVAENNPSKFFNRVMLQMANSLASGSDVALSLETALDQISKEQVIELKAYGQKLNPLVMFFMIFGIIMPSLGVAFIIIISSFLGGTGISFGPPALFGILAGVSLIQFIFLSVVEKSRPKFDIV